MMGLGFLLLLVLLGGLREVIGSGTWFANASLMLGSWADVLSIDVFSKDYSGFLLAILPPGAFICLGFILAVKNVIDGYLDKRSAAKAQEAKRIAEAEGQIIGGVPANE